MESWKTIYKAGAIALFLMAIFIPIQMVVFFVWPPPQTIIDWFHLFEMNKIVGLLDMDLLLIVEQVLSIFVFLALYMALRRLNQSLMTIALSLGFIGIATYLSSGSAFEMLRFSAMYRMSSTEAQRNIALMGGELALANWQGTAFDVAYIISGISYVLIALVMLKSNMFGKLIAYLTLAIGLLMIIPPTTGAFGMVCAVISVFPLWIWAILLGCKFLRLKSHETVL